MNSEEVSKLAGIFLEISAPTQLKLMRCFHKKLFKLATNMVLWGDPPTIQTSGVTVTVSMYEKPGVSFRAQTSLLEDSVMLVACNAYTRWLLYKTIHNMEAIQHKLGISINLKKMVVLKEFDVVVINKLALVMDDECFTQNIRELSRIFPQLDPMKLACRLLKTKNNLVLMYNVEYHT